MPKGVTWVKQAVQSFHPELNRVELTDGSGIGYNHLVVCPGPKLDWNKIEGRSEALGSNGVCSNNAARCADYTWEFIQAFRGGTALFTQPPMPIKCAGAPQKIMYLAGDAAGTTNAKTASAVRLQASVVVDGVLAAIDGKVSTGRYDGYGSCPLTTAYGKVVLAEFIYGGKVTPNENKFFTLSKLLSSSSSCSPKSK